MQVHQTMLWRVRLHQREGNTHKKKSGNVPARGAAQNRIVVAFFFACRAFVWVCVWSAKAQNSNFLARLWL